MKKIRLLFLVPLVGLFGFGWPLTWLSNDNTSSFGSGPWVQKEVQILKSSAGNIDTNVLRLSLVAYLNANKKGYAHKPVLTVIDYSKPSYVKRMWVFDLRNNRTIYNTWVSHGKNSGGVNATSFSNNPGSLKSSIGVFVTDEPYFGKNGYSVRLRGLEHGYNDNAYQRAIVIHGAQYASPSIFHFGSGIGRSWGCPAVAIDIQATINTIKENSVYLLIILIEIGYHIQDF